MAIDPVALGVGFAGLIIVLGVLLMKKTGKTKVSGIVPLMILGIIIGPATGLFDPKPYLPAINTVVTFILVVVLFDVGYDISLRDLKRAGASASLLGIGAALLTGLLTGALAYFALGLSWQLSLLFAALIISTDLTIVEPLLNALKVKDKHRKLLSLESTINSVFAAILAIIAVSLMQLEEEVVGMVFRTFLYNIFVGAAFGLILGYLIVLAVKHIKLEDKPHIISIGAVLLVFSLAKLVGASGIIAALLVGIVFRNSKQRLPKVIKTYSGDLEILLIVFVYVILGTLFNFEIFLSVRTALVSVGFVALVLLSRWVSAWLFTREEKDISKALVFLSGPRGIVSAVLVLTYAHLFKGTDVLGIVFLTIFVTALLTVALPFVSEKKSAGNSAGKK